jgi:hypothetical protein
VVTAVFTNGDTETIRANEGFYVGGGAALVDAARNIEVHLSLAFYRFARVRVGGVDEKFKERAGRRAAGRLAHYRKDRRGGCARRSSSMTPRTCSPAAPRATASG